MLNTILYVLLAAPQGEQQNPLVSLLPLILIILVFYLFMIRPQVRKQKELSKYRSSLEKGDKVVTTGGIYGKITGVSERSVNVDVGSNVEMKIDKNAILKDSSDLAGKK
jgi:preprotein translocase subunit YajC